MLLDGGVIDTECCDENWAASISMIHKHLAKRNVKIPQFIHIIQYHQNYAKLMKQTIYKKIRINEFTQNAFSPII